MLGDVTNTLLLVKYLPEAGSVLFLWKHTGHVFVLICWPSQLSNALDLLGKLADKPVYEIEASPIDAPKFTACHFAFVLEADWFPSHFSAANKYAPN